MEQEPKRLYKSRSDRKLCGVCAGIANYFVIDSTIVRLLFILAGAFTVGGMLLAYFIMAFVMPDEPDYM